MSKKLTVIICTYNRSEMLAHCLGSLCGQTSGGAFDVLVVDNNSTDDTRQVVESFMPELPLRYVMEPEQGLSHARNRGLAESRTGWVAYLDDDAKARPDWCAAILETIGKNDFEAFGGPYHAWHHFGPPPSWLPELYASYVPGQQYGPLEADTFIPGGNCAMEKSAAARAGAFPANFGMAGNKCAYGEESALFKRMAEQGGRLGYVPGMAIEHCVLPFKYSMRWWLKSFFSRGIYHQRMHIDASGAALLGSALSGTAKACIKTLCALLGIKYKKNWKAVAAESFIHPFFAAGRAYEAFFGPKESGKNKE